MSIVKSDGIRTRLHELEDAIVALSLRVRQLQREVAAPVIPAERRRRWAVWLETLVGSQRDGSSAPAMVRENRRVQRHAIHARPRSGL